MSTTHETNAVATQLYQKINYEKSGVSRQILEKDDNATYALVCITAGTLIPEHSTPRTVFLTILDGRGILTIDTEKISLERGIFVKILPTVPHSLEAIENLAFLHT
jgi:quercetin dioxygenase-like cupin family protein